MNTRFGPQLIGETEKTLNAILRRALHDPELTEPQWVTLRLSDQLDVDRQALVTALADRAHLIEPAQLVDQLTERGLLQDGRLTADGRVVLESVQAVIADTTAPIWHDLASDDVAAAERLLNEIVRRGRRVLATRQ
jgi:hypothetical protein